MTSRWTHLFVVVCALSPAHAFSPAYSRTGPGRPILSHQHVLRAISIDPKKTFPASERDRWDRTASHVAEMEVPCILAIDGIDYDLTAWAKAHPGGPNVLQKYHGKDASQAFHAAGHSQMAHDMLHQFEVVENSNIEMQDRPPMLSARGTIDRRPRWIKKLFTKEDPIGFHKTMGVFVLLHFLFRFSQMYFGDVSAGFGTRGGKGVGIVAPLCLIPHALLSLSSLIFQTVPKERVVGKPMIWQEYRVHNIAFGLRSVVCAWLGWLAYYKGNTGLWRRVAVIGSCLTTLIALRVADEGTKRLRVDNHESTTATMPYWDGCSIETQRKFKTFYAYCQFLATGACLAVGNPAWAFSVLIPIQMASLLMTLVRKGLLSARGYHVGYTISLCMPFLVGLRSWMHMKTPDFPVMLAGGWVAYQLRRGGVEKYLLWLPVMALRIFAGDQLVNWSVW